MQPAGRSIADYQNDFLRSSFDFVQTSRKDNPQNFKNATVYKAHVREHITPAYFTSSVVSWVRKTKKDKPDFIDDLKND